MPLNPIIWDDGDPHTFSASGISPAKVRSGTTMTYLSGASLVATAATGDFSDNQVAKGVNSLGSNIEVRSGASITGGSEAAYDYDGWGGHGLLSVADKLTMSGGTVTGGAGSQLGYAAGRVLNPVSGSAFTGTAWVGGAATDATNGEGGEGLSLDVDGSVPAVTLSGGTVTGGAGPALGGVGLDLGVSGAVTLSGTDVTGGAGTDGSAGMGGDAAVVRMYGASASLTISGGAFTAGSGVVGPVYSLRVETDGSACAAVVSGGTFPGGWCLSIGGATLTVTGTGLAYSAGVLSGTVGGVGQSIPVADASGLGVSAAGTSTSLVFTSP